MKTILIVLTAVVICSCSGSGSKSAEPKMSEKAKILYEKAEKKASDLEERVNQLGRGADRQVFISVLSDAKKLTYKVGETFSSEGLALSAKITNINQTMYISTGYTTNYDGHTFTADDAGTHDVIVTFAGKTVSYKITVEGATEISNAFWVVIFPL